MSAQPKLRLVTSRPPEPTGPLSPGALFREYSGYVATVAVRLLGRTHEVEDVVQDVFARAIRTIGNLQDAGAVKGFLATITVRVAQRRLYKRKIAQLLGAGTPTVFDAVSQAASPEHRALLAEVYALLESLPVRERIAWVLRHVEGHTLEEVAAITGCSLATTKRRLAAAHATLEQRFSHE